MSNTLNLHGGNVTIEILSSELATSSDRLEEKDNNGRTPLLSACFAKKWDVAKYLAEYGADVTAKDKVNAH